MSGTILAVDVGTSVLKVAVFDHSLARLALTERRYEPVYGADGAAEIHPQVWWDAFAAALGELRPHLGATEVISLSVTTPGLTAMDEEGTPLAPAILHLDGRGQRQAARLRAEIGDDLLLQETGNIPVSGGASLVSILWLRDERPAAYGSAAKFGHTNTFMIKRLTGLWAVDPSTASLSGMYCTPINDLRWHEDILGACRLSSSVLPPIRTSDSVIGTVLPAVARELGLPTKARVLCGANDAVLASLAGGLVEPGDVAVATGTTDIATTCLDRPIVSSEFNLRAHVIPDRWVTFFVLNTGGRAFEWFRTVFCSDMDPVAFYDAYLPSVLQSFLAAEDTEQREATLPMYTPFLGGSRYSLETRTAAFDGLTIATSRDDMLVSLVRGNISYLGRHLAAMRDRLPIRQPVVVSGGGSRIPGMLAARRRWMGGDEVVFREHSSLLGAATLARWVLDDVA